MCKERRKPRQDPEKRKEVCKSMLLTVYKPLIYMWVPVVVQNR